MSLDQILAFHCAPTLVGLKPANLISHKPFEVVATIKKALDDNAIDMTLLWHCNCKDLTLVYHREKLWQHLHSPEIWGYLMVQGYPMYSSLETIIGHLKKRIIELKEFPHEVGLFLGYPLIDVLGFIKNNGQNCKLCGYWKVYGDESEAKCLFDSFSKARDEMCAKVNSGYTVAEILTVAS